MYRNYDGQKSTFGQTSVKASAPDADKVSVFAAERNDGALTVIAINKQLTTAAPAILTLTNCPASTAQRWQLTSANAIIRLADQPLTGNTISNTLPAQSITLFVLPQDAAVRVSAPTFDSSNLYLTVSGVAGKNYAIESTADLMTWTRQQTNNAPASPFAVSFPRPPATRFYRAAQLN